MRAPLPSKHAKRQRTMSSLVRYYSTMRPNPSQVRLVPRSRLANTTCASKVKRRLRIRLVVYG